MIKKEELKNPDKEGKVDHPERRFDKQRNRIQDLNESRTRKNKQDE